MFDFNDFSIKEPTSTNVGSDGLKFGTSVVSSLVGNQTSTPQPSDSSFTNFMNLGTSGTATSATPASTLSTSAQTPAWYAAGKKGDWAGLLANRPNNDVALEYQQESTRDAKSKANLRAIGATDVNKFAEWWWNNYGKGGFTEPSPEVTGAQDYANSTANTALTGALNTASPYTQQLTIAPSDTARLAEQQRISGLLEKYGNLANSLRRGVSTADIYNGDNLTSLDLDLQELLDKLNAEKQAYSDVPLTLDDTKKKLEDVAALLGTRKTARQEALDREKAAIENVMSQMAGIQEFDETGLQGLAQALSRSQSNLSRFSGGVDSYVGALDNAMSQLDSRLGKISSTRSTVEGDAQAFLNRLRLANVGSQSDLDALMNEYTGLSGRASQWRASQAMDELSAIADLLGRKKTDLASVLKAAADAQAADAAKVKVDANGNSVFSRAVMRDQRLSLPQIAALRRRNTNSRTPSYSSSFSSNLGL